MTEKAIGYVLLVLGIVVIIFSAVSVYIVLTAQANPAQFWASTESGILNFSLPLEPSLPPVQVPLNIGEILPINRLVNTGIHVMLMSFLASIGAKLSGIGTNLVRPIVVKANSLG